MENGNQPAFAVSKEMCEMPNGKINIEEYPFGLTKREYFAGLAMEGITSNPDWYKSMRTPDDWDEYKQRAATASVEMADALLNALSK